MSDEGVSIRLGAQFNRVGTNGDGVADADVRNEHALAGFGHFANQPFTYIQHFGTKHLFDKFGSGGNFHGGAQGERFLRREEPFHRHAAQVSIGLSFKNTGAQCSGAEDSGVHHPFKQFGSIDSFADGLHHVVHEFEDDLLLLVQKLPLLV